MKLSGAGFENADLAGAKFDGADMRQTRLSTNWWISAKEAKVLSLVGVERGITAAVAVEATIPNFRCTDLSNASIRDLIIGAATAGPKDSDALHTHFADADLMGVDFDSARLVVLKRERKTLHRVPPSDTTWLLGEAPAIFEGDVRLASDSEWIDSGKQHAADISIGRALGSIIHSGRNFKQAKFSGFQQWPTAPVAWKADCDGIAKMTSNSYYSSLTRR